MLEEEEEASLFDVFEHGNLVRDIFDWMLSLITHF